MSAIVSPGSTSFHTEGFSVQLHRDVPMTMTMTMTMAMVATQGRAHLT